MAGVRPSCSTISTELLGSGRDLAHSASSWAARAISPLSAQFGSKSGDRQAMET